MTSTNAGMTPANRLVRPSFLINERRVAIEDGVFAGFDPGSTGSSEARFLVVMRVLTTQMGFVSKTVADPAMAPAIIVSTVVSFLEARLAFTAAFSKAARVHSYQ